MAWGADTHTSNFKKRLVHAWFKNDHHSTTATLITPNTTQKVPTRNPRHSLSIDIKFQRFKTLYVTTTLLNLGTPLQIAHSLPPNLPTRHHYCVCMTLTPVRFFDWECLSIVLEILHTVHSEMVLSHEYPLLHQNIRINIQQVELLVDIWTSKIGTLVHSPHNLL